MDIAQLAKINRRAKFEIDGEKYDLLMSPLIGEDFGMVREHLKTLQPDPFEEAKKLVEGLSETLARDILLRAYDDRQNRWGMINGPRGREWASSAAGMSYFFWLSVRRNHAEYADPQSGPKFFEALFQRMQSDALEEIMDKIDRVSGMLEEEDRDTAVGKPSAPTKKKPRKDPRKKKKKRARR